MSVFEQREQAFESRFFHEEEIRFRATARRNKLLGLWAAERMGLAGDDASEYARSVVQADLIKMGEDDVLLKLVGDMSAKGLPVSPDEVRKSMGEFMGVAIAQVHAEL
ncbi:DUF1476 domain-containing protein [Oryzibacter oryziterrae]|uniref:DUF1476 domain-containing protein n=1 Tax=Oryzibacter oryziterrae TaxID=2766474 RepID=UPI001F21E80B|nr:DUF1476 domain-containing protein [Oryzibacter oryziterrae]